MKYDIGLISKFVLEYNIGIPKSIILGLSVFLCGVMVICLLKVDNPKLIRNVGWSMFFSYLCLILCLTVICREGKEVAQLTLRPLWRYESLSYKLIAGSILNFLLFIPLGFSTGACMRNRNVMKALGIGFSLSLAIEMIQLLSKRGVCNIDDLILNTLGCVIGYWLFMLCLMMINTVREKRLIA